MPLSPYSVSSLLLSLLLHLSFPLITSAGSLSSSSSSRDSSNVTETSAGGTGTFFPTTRSGFANLTSTIYTETVLTVNNGSSTTLFTYSYDIGPEGIGWNIPKASDKVPLAQPSFLPTDSARPSSSVNTSNSISTERSSIANSTSTEKTSSGNISETARGSSKTGLSGTTTSSSQISSLDTAASIRLSSITALSDTTVSTGLRSSTNATTSSLASEAGTTTSTGLKMSANSTTSSVSSEIKTNASSAANSSVTSTLSSSLSSKLYSSTSLVNSTATAVSMKSTISSTGSQSTTSTVQTSSTSQSTTSTAPNSSKGQTQGTSTHGSDSITATVTTVPADFTGITLSNPSLTANQWITTTDAHSSTTLVPFLVVGGGRGVVLWNLPPDPDVEYELPGLPKFHMPCIKVFGISVGSCTTPPETDDSGDDTSSSRSTTQTSQTSSQSGKKTTASSSESTKQTTTSGTGSTSTTTSSTSSCSATETASDCVVSCAQTASGSSSSCSSYTTTCTRTTSACSVQGTTTTVSSNGTVCTPPADFISQTNVPLTQTLCNAGCATGSPVGTAVPSLITSGPAPTSDSGKRAVAGRVTMDLLQKRGSTSEISSLGGCALTTPAGQPLTRPGWPAVNAAMLKPEIAGKMSSTLTPISRYDRATSVGCVFTTTRLSAVDFSDAPPWSDFFGKNYANINNLASLDHAYEKAWLKQFFTSVISSTNAANTLTCNQMNQYFFRTACQVGLIQDVWDQLGSSSNLRFIAMSQYLNGNAKGIFFTDPGSPTFQQQYIDDPDWVIPATGSGWVWPNDGSPTGSSKSAASALRKMIQYWETVLYGVLEMKTDNMLDLIDRTNNAIYKQLQAFDDDVKVNPANMYGNTAAYTATFPNGIAEAYKDFMTNTILPQINTPPEYLTKLWTNRIEPMVRTSSGLSDVFKGGRTGKYYSQWEEYMNLVARHNKHYLTSTDTGTAYSWEYTLTFTWDVSKTKKLRRRDSCPVSSSNSSSSSSTSPSTTQASSTTAETTTQASSATTTTSTTAAATSPANTANACQGNQIEGSCTQASLPSTTPDSGNQSPVCNKVDATGSQFVRFNASKASSAASSYCSSLVSNKVVLSADSASPAAGKVANAAENGGDIALSVIFDVDSCEPGTATDEQKLDFSSFGQDSCYQYLYTAIAVECVQDSTWGDYNADYTLEGGVWAGSCALWSMAGEPAS